VAVDRSRRPKDLLERVPHHLRGYVLVQDYARYDEVDQQVWRYVLRRVFARLSLTAHPAYRRGLAQTGMSVDRIPRIEEMDERLSDFGWGAVCVDGFLPPRAFQEFQALGLLPINAEIRTPEHILYTPAPDILHEAAGHAPILPEPRYAEYLRRIGRIGTRAFTSQEDGRVYQAIYDLSEIKESPAATAADVARAEEALAAALAAVKEVSEASKISRLYWWTAEYGLIGNVDQYQLYGAGLLSSLGESASCHDPRVRKIPLSRTCVEVDYDITREQPQLFVARDFDHLHQVLDEVACGLAHQLGGVYALSVAQKSGEVATVELDSGAQITGRVVDVGRDADHVAWLRFDGRTRAGSGGKLFPGDDENDGLVVPLGPLSDGTSCARLLPTDVARCVEDVDATSPSLQHGARLAIRLQSGLVLRGTLVGWRLHGDGRLAALDLQSARLSRGDMVVFEPPPGRRMQWVLGDSVRTAFAGAVDTAYWPPNEPTYRRVPAVRPPRSAISLLDRLPSASPTSDAPFSAPKS
jgi:phenylalanine-4-hydroxylase